MWMLDEQNNIGCYGKDGSFVPKHRYDTVFGKQEGFAGGWALQNKTRLCVGWADSPDNPGSCEPEHLSIMFPLVSMYPQPISALQIWCEGMCLACSYSYTAMTRQGTGFAHFFLHLQFARPMGPAQVQKLGALGMDRIRVVLQLHLLLRKLGQEMIYQTRTLGTGCPVVCFLEY
eukprot:1145647-Pelagomonas_calceolata.AAC.8